MESVSDERKLFYFGVIVSALLFGLVGFLSGRIVERHSSTKITEWIGRPFGITISIPDTDKWFRITNATHEPICVEMGYSTPDKCGFIVPEKFSVEVPSRALRVFRDPIIERIIEADPKLSEPNTNPVGLNSEGKATIFYKPGSYRISLYSGAMYAGGTVNICNGMPLGDKIWETTVDVAMRDGRKYSGGITQYFNQDGTIAKNGFLCIQKAGTTIPETTYKRPTW